MKEPDFPQGFIKHCPLVLEAKRWRKTYHVLEDTDADFAACNFHPAGCGLICESCQLHLTRPFCGHKLDEEFLPQLEAYYKKLKAYWEEQQFLGAGI